MDQLAEPRCLSEGGIMGAKIRQHDWEATPLGAPATWPMTLVTLIEVVLGAGQPMFILWGEARTMLYNQGYEDLIGDRHSHALGKPFLEVWPEVRDDLVPALEQADAGAAVQQDDIMLVIERDGHPQETHFAYCYTPVKDQATGMVAGLLCACRETTAQVIAERRLQESEAEARGLLEGMSEGFMLIDRSFHVRRINAEGLRIDGRCIEQIEGRHLLDVWPEVASQPIWRWCQSLMTKRRADQRIYHHVSATTDKWFKVRACPSQGGLAVFYRDISTTKRAEQALHNSEAQFRALAQAIPHHAWTARPDGTVDWVNQQIVHYSGLDRDVLTEPAGWVRMVHPDDAAVAVASWNRSLATGDPYEIKVRIRRVDGRYRRHLVRAQALRGENGGIRQWVGTNTNVEDQHGATEAMTGLNVALEHRVTDRTIERDRIWRHAQDLLVVIGADGVFRAANPAWVAMLGYQPEAVVGRSFLDFVWPDDAAVTADGLRKVACKQDLANFENRYRHRDGTHRWISWHTAVEGDLVYGYGRDITAEKEQAEALLQTEEVLRQSQKMEAVGQLTGGLAHDFNNLLMGITGSLELLQMRVAQGRLKEIDRYFNAAQGAAERAAALTHRLLAFSRRQTLDPKTTDVNRLIGGMEELIRRTVGPLVATEVTGARELWTTRVDPNQLESALLNLCINARDAMPEGGRLTIATDNRRVDKSEAQEKGLPDGHYVVLCVSDTGAGMTPEVMRRAFDPFYTTKPIGLGTGLGLSMVYGFVRQSGGQVLIDSKPGQGTTVCLYLPQHAGEAVEANPLVAPVVPQPADDGQTVLVVDDESMIRMLVAEVLEEEGFSSLEAADGPEGLLVLESDQRIDLLITDVGLPGGLNGRQLADAARIIRPDLKVLFITGYAENAVVRNGQLEAGMHLLTKPFTMEDLAARLGAITER